MRTIGDIEISLPKMPDPIPPEGFIISWYQVMWDGPSNALGKGDSLRAAAGDLKGELCDCVRVYVECKGAIMANEADAMIAEWNQRKGRWDEWEWL